jgi:F-type H+-transporting ATPase subunit a
MADAILHIKDTYYFEVPKMLWRHNYQSLEEVPKFLRDEHPDVPLEQFNTDLHGKILIPQPFGTLKNLYTPESGFCISKFMILELAIAAVIFLIFTRLAKKMKQDGPAPKGRFRNLFETFVLFIRDDVARPAIGHGADKFLPVLLTMFFFILGCNLSGLVPWLGTPTAAFGATLALAMVTFLTGLIAGSKKFGIIGYWTNLVPSMDLPVALSPLKLMIFVIEVAGNFIKHAVLAVRLLANMVAGHLVLLAVLGLIVAAAKSGTGTWATVTVISLTGSILFSLLELFVAFLQAYVFTFLSALFIGAATHHH